jgi:hypothetical protein
MTRDQFDAAFREARCVLRVMLEKPDPRSGRVPTKADKAAAEEQWIAGVGSSSRGAGFKALGALSEPMFLSNGALFAYRHGLYYTDRTSWRGWVKDRLARRKAA